MRARALLLAVFIATASATQAADSERFKRVGEGLMCNCGCNQILVLCTHANGFCPNSNPMKAELSAYLEQGLSDSEVLDKFVEKYGTAILSAPPVAGFNLVAWLAPFVALLGGLAVVAIVVRNWKARQPATAEGPAITVHNQSRLEEELKKYSPED